MMKKVIAGWNAAPGAPRGWDPKAQGECVALPIRVMPPCALQGLAPVQFCESAWEPTPEELEWLNKGGQLVLRVVGWQVPVALYVEPPPPEDVTA
jgi:hypothetical protein